MRVPHRLHAPSVLWYNQQTVGRLVLRPKQRNHRGDFEAQITKPKLPVLSHKPGNSKPPVLRPNREKPSTLISRPNQETCAPYLLVYGADRTQYHPTSRSSGHRVFNLCLTIPGHLHQISYSYHDPHWCLSCRICHLNTRRLANTILHTNR
jgi:hypothetical protein